MRSTWCGGPGKSEAEVAAFIKLGTLLGGHVDTTPYGRLLAVFDPFPVDGRRTFMGTCWLPALDAAGIDAMIQAMASAVPPNCASSPTSSKAPIRGCRWRQQLSVCVATMC